jgi:hypothetical protein
MMSLFRHHVHIVGFLLLAFSFLSGGAFAQSDPDDLGAVLGEEILAPGAALLQMKSYILGRVLPPPVPASAAQWTEEARRLRRRLLQDVAFHGWPGQWVNFPPKFEEVGAMGLHLKM